MMTMVKRVSRNERERRLNRSYLASEEQAFLSRHWSDDIVGNSVLFAKPSVQEGLDLSFLIHDECGDPIFSLIWKKSLWLLLFQLNGV